MALTVHQANGVQCRKALRYRRALLGVLVGLLFVASSARAQDPVEKLRRALQVSTGEAEPKRELLEKRRKMIESSLAEIRTIAQLRRAYFLKEWGTHVEFEKVDKELKIDRFRGEIGSRLTKAINLGAQDPDPDIKIPIASLIAEMADADQPTENRGSGKFARVFTKTVSQLVQDENLLVRQYALSALGKITPKPDEVVPLLRHTLKTDALGPRRFAAYALGDLVKNTVYLKAVEDDKKRGEENDELQTILQVTSAAGDGLRDADERIRGYCLQAIFESAKALSEYIGSTSQLVRVDQGKRKLNRDVNAVFSAMQTVNPLVLDRLGDPQNKVRATALQTMDQICQCRSKLIQTLHDFAPENHPSTVELLQSVDAADPLGNIARGDWKKIVPFLRDDDIRIRRGVAEILEQLGDQVEPAAEDLTRALSDPDRWVRWTAARALRHLGQKRISTAAVRALGAMLSDPDPDLSAAAADALAELGPNATEAVDALVMNVVDGDVENRVKAMNALVRIGPPAGERATPKVIDALRDTDVRVRRAAAETLGQFGSAAQTAIPALRDAMRDSDATVRLNASEAILSIAPSQKKL